MRFSSRKPGLTERLAQVGRGVQETPKTGSHAVENAGRRETSKRQAEAQTRSVEVPRTITTPATETNVWQKIAREARIKGFETDSLGQMMAELGYTRSEAKQKFIEHFTQQGFSIERANQIVEDSLRTQFDPVVRRRLFRGI